MIQTSCYTTFLTNQPPNSADLILTDPPYCISKPTGFSHVGPNGIDRFAVSMDFGEWDKSEIDLDQFCKLCYGALRKGGTLICFYDLWKLSHLKDAMVNVGFVQLRFIEWIKTNPVPLNSKRNYLTNAREIAVCATKGSKPTFNGEYDKGIYQYPIENGKRYHPTQKSLTLISALVLKHSDTNDLILDPFLGSGTTAIAALHTNRRFIGCDINPQYTAMAKDRIRTQFPSITL